MTPGAWKRELAADFRRQLALPQQQHLFDYWLARCADDAWPRRDAIRPGDIRQLLPALLLLEMVPLPDGVRVRLAGSDLWDVYGGELTGASLRDDRWGAGREYWQRVYEQLHGATLPMSSQGLGLCARDHLALFWLRLPLSSADGRTFLLGLDIAVPASRVSFDIGNAAMAAKGGNFPEQANAPSSRELSPPRLHIRIDHGRRAAPSPT